MKRIVSYILFIFCMWACANTPPSELPFFNSEELEPEWISPSDSKFTRIHKVKPFSFLNQDSVYITNKDFDGSIYITDFFFTTCPSICPKMTSNMLKLQTLYKNQDYINFLSHSVTPWIDTVAQLKRYAMDKGVISGKWHLVTGDENEIYKQARTSYFVEGKIGQHKELDDFVHTENFVLVDAKRRIRGIYNGTLERDIERLIEDIDTLLGTMSKHE